MSGEEGAGLFGRVALAASGLGNFEFEAWPQGQMQETATPVSVGLSTSYCPPTPFSQGTWNWTVLACDAVGNCQQANEIDKFIIDTTPPVLNVPANQTVEATSGQGATDISAFTATATVRPN